MRNPLPQTRPGTARQSPSATARSRAPQAPPLPTFEVTGPANAPVIVVLGGISATAHVTSGPHDPSPGWWSDVVGDRKAVDTTRYRVLGIDFVDGGRGANGRPRKTVTTHDQADAMV